MSIGGWKLRGAVLALVAGVSASLLTAGPTLAGDPDLGWPPSTLWDGPREGDVGFVIEDTWILGSAIRVASPGWQPVCDSLDDVACLDLAARYGWWITRMAPPCERALAWEECIEGLSLISADGVARPLEFAGQAPGRTFPPDEARGLPTGSTLSLFRDPASPDPTFGYVAYLGGQMGGPVNGVRPFRLNTFSAQVIPYRLVPEGQQPAGGTCLWREDGQCAYRLKFPDGVSVRMSMRLSNTVTGWLGGRLTDPSIEVTALDEDLNRLAVIGAPVDVPLIGIAVPSSSATPEILTYWSENFHCDGRPTCVVSGQSWNSNNPELLSLFQGFLGDTAVKVVPTWSISSLPQTTPQPCLGDRTRLVGLVTTNASVYSAAPPAFEEGLLKYSVAALHRVPGGEVFSGSYDLVLRGDAARCLYGFSDAPVTAAISVTSDDGTEQVATTSVSERDGWIHLAAYGFHFSQPTISVRLKSAEPAKKTIFCKKGKRIKKVVGLRPECPAGWRPIRR